MKRNISIVFLTLTLLFSSSCDSQEPEKMVYEDEMIKDIIAYREGNVETKIDITDIVERRINIGDNLEGVLTIFKKNGFKYELLDDRAPESSKYDQIFLATYDTRNSNDLGFGDVIRIVIKVNNKRVSKVSGTVIYMHL